MGPKLIKILARIGIILVALVAVVFVIRAVFSYSAGKKLENFLDRAKAEGIPLNLKDIEPDCDPRYNAALDWKKAEASLSVEKAERELLNKVINDLFFGDPMEKKVREQIQDLADKNREALDFMLEASSKTCFKSRDDWYNHACDFEVNRAIQMIQGTRLLGIDAVLKAEKGHAEEAISQCLAAKRFLELHLQEPFLVNYLVNMACMKQLAVCLDFIVSDREIETDTLENILQEWDNSPWKEGLVWALQSENIFQLESALLYLRGENDLYLGPAGDSNRWLFHPVLKNEIIWMKKAYDRLIEAAELPYHVSRDSNQVEQIKNETPWTYKMMGALVPDIEAVLLKRATLDALFDTARIGIACKIFKNLNGDFPDELSELSPGILDEIPVDPFTGNPYVYRKGDSGFIVYSVGSNQKDEGGRGTWKITQKVMEKDDDWAWKEEANFIP